MGRRKRRSYYGKVVWPTSESPSKSRTRRSSDSDKVWLDSDSERPADEEALEQRVQSSSNGSPAKLDQDTVQVNQVNNDVDGEFSVVKEGDYHGSMDDNDKPPMMKEERPIEKSDYEDLAENADKPPTKKKKTGTHIISFMIEGNKESSGEKPPAVQSSVPTSGVLSPDAVSPDISVSAFSTGKEIAGSTSSEIDNKIPVIPIDHRTYEESEMGDEYYIARNDSESIVVRQMHPECRVMIPADYDTALNEIKTCPLDCPYKFLEFAEIDQKTLRNR